ncbi:MAG: starch-binding protein [Bacteroides sp.]|nr:starch-binding protein [Bacteroides sp.]
MKKNIFYLLLLMPLLAFLGSCDDKDEIVFDHELPQFELKENAILLEVIMPQGTGASEKLYIAGAFNGGEEAVGQPEWCLEKAANSDVKWGIYLNHATFKDGKTLADGFCFVSDKQGVERTVKNEDMLHTLNVGVGTRTNVTVSRWEAYFAEEPEEIPHDGYAIYVEDNSGWDALALYAWGDAEFAGGWPGMQVTGTKTIGKVTYKYFDTGEASKGMNVNLIFNNNNGGKQIEGDGLPLSWTATITSTSQILNMNR